MTKFKVGDKVRVIDVKEIFLGSNHYYDGMETEVVDIQLGFGVQLRNKKGNAGIYIARDEVHAIELIESTPPKQTKSERISALEAEAQRQDERITDLERKIAELSDYSIVRIPRKHGKSDFVEALLTPKSPNEQRKAIIAEAKAFVERYSGFIKMYDVPLSEKHGDIYVDLYVNAEKRTVVAVPKLWHIKGVIDSAKAVAKAHPDDVFNADIGKAIALGRALGLDVKRFEKAVQPTELFPGMVVHRFNMFGRDLGLTYVLTDVTDESDFDGVNLRFNSGMFYTPKYGDFISDDTEAQY